MNDLEYLKSKNVEVDNALELWGDEESFKEALKEYQNSLPQKLSDLQLFLKSQDDENYAILVHSIKSESKYLGFMKQAEVFYEHELQAKEGNHEFLETHFTELRKTIHHIITILNEFFHEKKNLLVADDSDIILNFIEKNTKEDYNVLKAEDGSVALDLLKNNHIYAILLDLNMPKLNGFEVLAYFDEFHLFEEIPVVVITGNDTSENIEIACSYPIVNILKKPFNDTSIKSTLDKIEQFYHRNS